MRAIVLKELRQLVHVGGFATLSLSGLLAFGLYANNAANLSLVDRSFQLIVAIAFATVGLGLGLVAVLPDLRRGHFGFAVHRPASRTTLLIGKFLAAGIVYALATSVAVLVATWCATNPRFVKGPFHVSMLLPTLYFQVAGLAWIACGLLVAVRQARWFGSRLFPAIAAIVLSMLGPAWVMHFSQAVVVAMVLTALLLVVAVAYFKHNGHFAPQPLWSRVLSGLVVLTGSGVVVGVTVSVIAETIESLSGRPGYRGSNLQYNVDDDGRPYREDLTAAGPVYQDVNGNPIPAIPLQKRFQPDASVGVLDVHHADAPRTFAIFYESFLSPEHYLQPLWTRFNGEIWLYVVPKRVLEGFSHNEGVPLGQIGQDGGLRSVAVPFESSSRFQTYLRTSNTPLILSDEAVYAVEPGQRTVRRVLEAEPGQRLLAAAVTNYRYDEQGEFDKPRQFVPQHIVGVATDRVYVRPMAGVGPTRVVRIPPLGPSALVRVKLLDQQATAVLVDSPAGDESPVLVVDRQGTATQQTLPRLPQPGYEPFWTNTLPMAFAPLAVFPLEWLTDGLPVSKRDGLAMLGGGLFAVLLTAWMTRRYRLSIGQRGVWVALALVIGPTVPVTLLCLRERPRRVACPTCGKKRPIDTEQCPSCGAAWPTPGNVATDVFESRTAA